MNELGNPLSVFVIAKISYVTHIIKSYSGWNWRNLMIHYQLNKYERNYVKFSAKQG